MYLLNRFEHEHEIINQQIYNMSEYIIIVLFTILSFIIVGHVHNKLF
jgi:hypothetical protein